MHKIGVLSLSKGKYVCPLALPQASYHSKHAGLPRTENNFVLSLCPAP